jgi:hypothetical protein
MLIEMRNKMTAIASASPTEPLAPSPNASWYT